MYAPLAAFSSAGRGFLEGKREAADDLVKQYDMMGMQALGNAFQQPAPQPPMPGQGSVPAQPPMPMPSPDARGMPGAGPPMPPPMMAQAPMPGAPSAAGGPSAAPQQAPPAGPPPTPAGGMPAQGPDGMPQFDLPTLIQRIQTANPSLPPQAMAAAIARATPLLSMQGKFELAAMRNDAREQAIKVQQGFLDLKRGNTPGAAAGGGGADDGTIGGYTPEAITQAAERFRKSGQLPPGLRDRAGGNVLRSAIANKAAELDKAEGINPADVAKRQQVFKAEQNAITRFMSGPQGNTVRSLNVVVDHLATMRDLGMALQNGNVQAFNRISQAFAEQTGNEAPTNFNTAKQIVGAEIIKALGVAGAGTMAERQEAANAFKTASSPDQLIGAIKVAQRLLGGQVGGLRKQFVAATGLKGDKFDEMLGDEAKGFMNPTAPAAASGGWSVKEIPQAK